MTWNTGHPSFGRVAPPLLLPFDSHRLHNNFHSWRTPNSRKHLPSWTPGHRSLADPSVPKQEQTKAEAVQALWCSSLDLCPLAPAGGCRSISRPAYGCPLRKPIIEERSQHPKDVSPDSLPESAAARDVHPHQRWQPILLQLLQGSTGQNCFASAAPHAGSRWLSHRGVTTFRHTHARPPVRDESHSHAAGLICTHLQAHMDFPGCLSMKPRPPWTELIDSRSRPISFHIATLTPTPF
jgi:hypothetical protein